MLSETQKPLLTVTQLTRQIKLGLESSFSNLWVTGEVSNFTRSSLGHAYFTLKDSQSQLRVVVFKNRLRYFKALPENGRRFIAHGSLSLYEKRGEYQLNADYLEPKGIGSLQLAFEELKNRLQREGLFEGARKKELPFLPRTIGVITSAGGAALQDILSVSLRRFPNLYFIIKSVPVQGDEAAKLIVAAIARLNKIPTIEVIILARGGGSLEDLWCFNEERVARAIYNSPKPVVSAIGHETDFTIADFVADLRAPTPSAAAEVVVKDKKQLYGFLSDTQRRLFSLANEVVRQKRRHLLLLSNSRLFKEPALSLAAPRHLLLDDYRRRLSLETQRTTRLFRARVNEGHRNLLALQPTRQVHSCRLRLREAENRLRQCMAYSFYRKKDSLQRSATALDALSPLKILERGYAICRAWPERTIISEARQVKLKQQVHIRLSQGGLICRIEEIEGKHHE